MPACLDPRSGLLHDLGLVAEIPEELRKPWVETFVAVASCDGKRAAELFYVHSPLVAVRVSSSTMPAVLSKARQRAPSGASAVSAAAAL